MKFNHKSTFLIAASLIVQQCNAVEFKPTFQDESCSKNIAFFSAFGGSSHVSWVLSIGNELGIRGHNFTFITVVST